MNKQYNLKGESGLYLTYKPSVELTSGNYQNLLIEDYDFFPKTINKANLYDFKNSRYDDQKIIGSNSKQLSNSNLKHSEISLDGELILNQSYYNQFKLYFRFTPSTIADYTLSGLTKTQTKRILDRLRVKIYISLGSNIIPTELTNLQKYVTNNWVNVEPSDVTGAGSIVNGDYGIQLATGLNNEDCIDMAYTGTTTVNNLFTGYTANPDGYNFRVDVKTPTFIEKVKTNKKYKIIIKYLNIGVSSTGIYTNSEDIELMSDNYIVYTQSPTPPSL